MGFFRRVRRIVSANLNDLVSKAEHPEKMLNQLIEEMHDGVEEATHRVAAAMAAEKQLRRTHEEAGRNLALWDERARSAAERDEDDLAREALRRKHLHAEIAASYERELEHQGEATRALRTSLDALKAKLEEAKGRKRGLVARYHVAQAKSTISQKMIAVTDQSALRAFERMAQRIEDMEAIAEASLELSAEDLERKFEQPEVEAQIEGELKALKGTAPAAAPAEEPAQAGGA